MCSNSAIYKLVFDQYLQLCKDHYLFSGIYSLMYHYCYLSLCITFLVLTCTTFIVGYIYI